VAEGAGAHVCGMTIELAEREGAVHLRVRVQPRAARTELAGEHEGALRIRLAAPPVDGEANAELTRFVAKQIGIAASRVRIAHGQRGRSKVVAIDGVDVATVRRALLG
jgi:uncharacterized protein